MAAEAEQGAPKLSVVMPVYNERDTIELVLHGVWPMWCMAPDSSAALELREDRFGFEPEITAKIAKGHWRIYEGPISYWGRTYAEGKKITWKDGVTAVWYILRYNLFD